MAFTNIDKVIENLIKQIDELEAKVKSLEKTQKLDAHPADFSAGVRITGSLETLKISPLNISEAKLVEIYNDVPQVLINSTIEVTLTAHSYRGNSGQDIFIEKSKNGNYWAIPHSDLNYWLVPQGDTRLNIHKLKTIERLFNFQGEHLENSNDFTLIKPARISLMPDGEQWQLQKLGVLQLNNGTSSIKYQSALDLTNKEREKLQESYQKSQQDYQEFTAKTEKFYQDYHQLKVNLKQAEQERVKLRLQLQQYEQDKYQLQAENQAHLLQFQSQIEQIVKDEIYKIQLNYIPLSPAVIPTEEAPPSLLQNEAKELGSEDLIIEADFQPTDQLNPTSNDPISNVSNESFKLLHSLTNHTDAVKAIAYNSAKQIIVSASLDRTVKVWKLKTKQLIATLNRPIKFNAIAIASDTQAIAATGEENYIEIWQVATGESNILKGHTDIVRCLAMAPDGKILASGSRDETIRIWDWQKAETLDILKGHDGPVLSIAFSADGQTLVSSSADKTIKIWNLSTKRLPYTLCEYDTNTVIWSVAITPDGKTIVSGNHDGSIDIWALHEKKLLHTLTGHQGRVWSVAISPDGQTIASASEDTTIKLWNINGELWQTLTKHTKEFYDVTFCVTPEGKEMLISCNKDGAIDLWQKP